MAKENTIRLTLPNVTLFCENESYEIGGDAVDENESTTGKTFLGQHETLVFGDIKDGGSDNTQYSCYPHITSNLKRERVSPELQDLYKLLMQLPNFSHTNWSGFGSTTRKILPPTSTTKSKGKIRKLYTSREGRKVGKHASCTQSMDSFQDDKESLQTEIGNQNKQRNREVIKLHSINLYQSILPSSLFSNMHHRIGERSHK